MQRHAECNNRVLFTELFKPCRIVTPMPIKNKKLIFSFYIRLSVFIEMLNLGIPNLIISLSILANYNYLVI